MRWSFKWVKTLFGKSYSQRQKKDPMTLHAGTLPEGWHWLIDADGDGRLISPNGVVYIEYWLHSVGFSPALSYSRIGEEDADISYQSPDQFRESSERYVRRYFLPDVSEIKQEYWINFRELPPLTQS